MTIIWETESDVLADTDPPTFNTTYSGITWYNNISNKNWYGGQSAWLTISNASSSSSNSAKFPIMTASTISADADTTYTASQVVGGLIVRTGMTSDRDDTLPTPAQIVAEILSTYGVTPVVGMSFTCKIFNTTNKKISDLDDGGNTYIYPTSAGDFGIRKEESRIITFVLNNVSSGSEAISCYTNRTHMKE